MICILSTQFQGNINLRSHCVGRYALPSNCLTHNSIQFTVNPIHSAPLTATDVIYTKRASLAHTPTVSLTFICDKKDSLFMILTHNRFTETKWNVTEVTKSKTSMLKAFDEIPATGELDVGMKPTSITVASRSAQHPSRRRELLRTILELELSILLVSYSRQAIWPW